MSKIIFGFLCHVADVMILADVFEAFRDVSLANYDLDPAHYVSPPQLSWDAMLHVTGCELTLIQDKAMFQMIDNGLRGGVSMISQRYSKANNKYMGARYDPKKPSVYDIYWDANNLYGWAMSQPMPCGDFNWMEEAEFNSLDWIHQKVDQEFGFIVECDMDYPNELHEDHNDYPLAPERFAINHKYLSEKQVALRRNYSMAKSSGSRKLVPNLLPKEKIALHYLNLKFYMEHGMVLKKIHRAVSFRQSRWLAPYIKKNQDLRAAAKNDFEKDFFKLMNNAVYGKTCENLKKRTNIKLLIDERKAKHEVDKPHCLAFKIFGERLIGVNMRKVKVEINKPFYVGFCVLELSKLHMFNFHYNFIKKLYGKKAHLLFTDTDSLMYEIEANDVYQDMWDYRERFDLANYPRGSKFYDPTNNKVCD